MGVIKTLQDLEATTKRGEKETILQEGLKDEYLCRFLRATYDPYVTYGLKGIPVPPAHQSTYDPTKERDHLEELFELLDSLASREITGNRARSEADRFLRMLPIEEQRWFHHCIRKDLKCGVDTKTINKVKPGLIPQFEVQLAHELEVSRKGGRIQIDDRIRYPVWVDYKLDGRRMVAIRTEAGVTLYSRNGLETKSMPELSKILEAMPVGSVIDGEAMGKDWAESQSVLSSTKNVKDESAITYYVFDLVPLKEWSNGVGTMPFSYRHEQLAALVNDQIKSPRVTVVWGEVVEDEEALWEFYDDALLKGHEGIMVKDLDAPYQFTRTKFVRKLKPKQTWDGQIVGWEMGAEHGKWAGGFGAFLVQFCKDGPVTKVGGGYTDAERAEIFAALSAHPKAYDGRWVEVEGQELTSDGVVRFPVFVHFRDDKDT